MILLLFEIYSSYLYALLIQLPEFMHFGVNFEISSCVAISILFVVNSVQAIGAQVVEALQISPNIPQILQLKNCKKPFIFNYK